MKTKKNQKFWKIDFLEKLIKSEKSIKGKCDIKLDYVMFLENQLKLMKEAFEAGKKFSKSK